MLNQLNEVIHSNYFILVGIHCDYDDICGSCWN